MPLHREVEDPQLRPSMAYLAVLAALLTWGLVSLLADCAVVDHMASCLHFWPR